MESSPQGKKPSRFGLVLPFALLLLAGLGWTAWWYIASQQINRGVDQWLQDQAADGVGISYASRQFGGYPFRFELSFDQPAVTNPAEGLSWQGDRAEFVMQAWNLKHMIAFAPGHNVVTGPDGIRNTIDLDAHAAISVSWDEAGVRRFGLQSGEAEALIEGQSYAFSNVSLNLAPRPESPDDLMIAVQWDRIDIEAPPEEAAYLGTELGPSRLIGEVQGFFPALERTDNQPDRLWGALLEEEGGVEIAQLLLNWGPLDLGAQTKLKLTDGKANGTIKVRLDNAEALQEAMTAAGAWNEQTQLAIGALEVASRDGGFLPLPVINNKIYVGPVEIGEFPGAGS